MSENSILVETALILGLAVGSQALAAKFNLPSIVVLLIGGLLAGPALGLLDPDELFGDRLMPMVSLAVGIILFEGGLLLDFRDMTGHTKPVVRRLLSIGVALSTALGAAAAGVFLGVEPEIALVLGALLTVSGPTVVLPLLTFVRPTERVASALKWEGILVDAIGASLAVIVVQGVLSDAATPTLGQATVRVLYTLGVGAAIGAGAAAVLLAVLHREHFGPHITPAVTLAAVVGTLVVADLLRDESGLLAAIVMGVAVANQRRVDVASIVEFKETLSPLLSGVLFIVLSARLTGDDFALLGAGVVGFIAVLVIIVRPVAVACSTWRSALTVPERSMIAAMAPRGIVAAATASVFADQLGDAGVDGAELIAPVTFAVILATAIVYGFGGPVAARVLGVRRPANKLSADQIPEDQPSGGRSAS